MSFCECAHEKNVLYLYYPFLLPECKGYKIIRNFQWAWWLCAFSPST